jgi:multiple sugar transport system permease protein
MGRTVKRNKNIGGGLPARRGLRKRISDAFYDFSLPLRRFFSFKRRPAERKMMTKKRRDLIFYVVMIAFPVVWFAVFYVAVNLNSILLAFRTFDYELLQYKWAGFGNFAAIIEEFNTSDLLWRMIKNSLVSYAVGLIVGVPLALLFSFYISKEYAGHGFFKIILFLPSVISAIVMVILYKYFIDRLYPEFMLRVFGKSVLGLLTDGHRAFGAILFYSVLVSFGVSVLIYSGAIGRIPASLTEAAKMDGITPMREFWYITLPLIYPTLTTFLIVGVVGIFTNQLNLFSFYGPSAEYSVYTLGYFLFTRTQQGSLGAYPQLSAYGLLFTLIAAPLTLGIKTLLEKAGPEAAEF